MLIDFYYGVPVSSGRNSRSNILQLPLAQIPYAKRPLAETPLTEPR